MLTFSKLKLKLSVSKEDANCVFSNFLGVYNRTCASRILAICEEYYSYQGVLQWETSEDFSQIQ